MLPRSDCAHPGVPAPGTTAPSAYCAGAQVQRGGCASSEIKFFRGNARYSLHILAAVAVPVDFKARLMVIKAHHRAENLE